MPIIKVILGSTRPNRFGPQPAAWIMQLSKAYPDASFELVDLAEVQLPFLDEPLPPSSVVDGKYEHAHTRAWAKVIDEADGFIIVTPEYDYGVPAALKNAIDFVSNEWNYKPVAFVSYGASAGGARAVEHLRGSAGWLRLYDLREQVVMPNYWGQLDKNGKFQPTESQTRNAKDLLEAVIFWSNHLKSAREELAKTV
jgi:NAD(P)H-dependent FMN reductase